MALDNPAFSNARAPLAQEFRPAGGASYEDFLVIVNHFKSKGSGSGVDADQGDGQGASNHARTLQAQALIDFAAARETAAGDRQGLPDRRLQRVQRGGSDRHHRGRRIRQRAA